VCLDVCILEEGWMALFRKGFGLLGGMGWQGYFLDDIRRLVRDVSYLPLNYMDSL